MRGGDAQGEALAQMSAKTGLLVFGGSGQIGHELCRATHRSGVGVTGLGHGDVDITRIDDVLKAVGESRPAVVVNAAAYTRVDQAESEPEAAFAQGVSKEFYASVAALGGDAVEVSSAQVAMSLDDKCGLIAMARDSGLDVVAEAGQKGHEDWTRSEAYVLSQIEAFQKAGAWKVLIQGEGISEGVAERKDRLILAIAARFGIKDLIFQAKDGATQEWFINTLGNAVNLDVDDDQIIDLELMRRGIRKRGVFGLLGSLDKG